jgi:hypothetical protein
MEGPFPRFSLVINSANRIESIDPIVNERIIFRADSIPIKYKWFYYAKSRVATQ